MDTQKINDQWFSAVIKQKGGMGLKAFNEFIKKSFRKLNIQFRKIDPRRSENIVLGINYDCLREQKKILVSYMDYGRTAYSMRYAMAHTNLQEMFQMIKVLIDMDFCIDVCDCDNPEAAIEMPSDYYDYILGFGDMFRLARQKNPKAYTILYMTENPYAVSKTNEQQRNDYFYERTGRRISFARTGKFYHEGDELLADAVICLGEIKYFSNRIVRRVYPTAMKNSSYTHNSFARRERTNFIVLGVKGFVHKGNDLLIEVFQKHPDWNLYMCGREIRQECRKYGLELPRNVVDCGFVEIGSQKFLELAQICAYILLPSCSEGMSTGLLTGMRHGLIPVTTKGTGMDDLSGYCQYFEGYKLEQIEDKLLELVDMDVNEMEKLSDAVYEYANQVFIVDCYTRNLREVLTDIIQISEKELR